MTMWQVLLFNAHIATSLRFALMHHNSKTINRAAAPCCSEEAPAALDDFTMAHVQSMMSDVRAHYRSTGELDEGQACRNLMVTRVKDFAPRINRCHVGPSTVHGDGLFATRDIASGDLITFFPGDAMLVWEDGNREGDLMIFFGAHM